MSIREKKVIFFFTSSLKSKRVWWYIAIGQHTRAAGGHTFPPKFRENRPPSRAAGRPLPRKHPSRHTPGKRNRWDRGDIFYRPQASPGKTFHRWRIERSSQQQQSDTARSISRWAMATECGSKGWKKQMADAGRKNTSRTMRRGEGAAKKSMDGAVARG